MYVRSCVRIYVPVLEYMYVCSCVRNYMCLCKCERIYMFVGQTFSEPVYIYIYIYIYHTITYFHGQPVARSWGTQILPSNKQMFRNFLEYVFQYFTSLNKYANIKYIKYYSLSI